MCPEFVYGGEDHIYIRPGEVVTTHRRDGTEVDLIGPRIARIWNHPDDPYVQLQINPSAQMIENKVWVAREVFEGWKQQSKQQDHQ